MMFPKNYVLPNLAVLIVLLLFSVGVSPAMGQEAIEADMQKAGKLYLVGLGVGDMDNMTIRARNTIAEADIIFAMKGVRKRYAPLFEGKEVYEAGHGLFGMGHPNAKKDGKGESKHAGSGDADKRNMKRHFSSPEEMKQQQEKNRTIIREAVAAGKIVAVIDSGDPTIYGPQVCYLHEFADLSPQVIPGLSSFNAANAALQRDVTKGLHSSSVVLTAARGAHQGYHGSDSLAKLAESRSTMVFFTMGMKLDEVVDTLKKSYPGDTPMAIVFHAGDSKNESVMRATIDTLLEKTEGRDLPFEHLIYVGDFLR